MRRWGYATGLPGVDEWGTLFNTVLRTVESLDYCEIDWDMLDQDYQYWMEDSENGIHAFAQWLEYVPVARYGFSAFDDNWPEEYPCIGLLKALLDADWTEEFLVRTINDYDLQADWTSIYHYELVERVNTADFSTYAAPLCWLPDVARIACGQTGNALLDFSNYMEDEPPQYGWNELDALRELWQKARPQVEKLRAFLQWCTGPEEMQAVVNALVGRGERKRKPRSKLNTLVDILTPGVER